MKTIFVAGVILIAFMGHAAAQCPAGVPPSPNCVPPDGPGWRHNMPAPNTQPPAAPRPVWKSTWGAIAADGPNAALGTASGAKSKRVAEQIALKQCRERGGKQCVLDASYFDQCAVMVTGDKNYIVQTAVSIERATDLAMGRCNERDTGCRVLHTDCSVPVRID
ncbi:DUF4189 domain-containing protein [Lysobacter firmicutimachus]|uniref:DUF4189 domain-containing protein n=1 Tax=Lysobacter firmicutimachus TaxID=1792846 RepID=A0AAU8MQA5_9GAMM